MTGSYKGTAKDLSRRIRQDSYSSYEEHYADLAEHGRIHEIFDALEEELGAKGVPPNTATLDDLEANAAAAVAAVTGCDPDHIQKQLRDHHQKKGLGPKSRFRADPDGAFEDPKPGVMGTNAENLGGFP